MKRNWLKINTKRTLLSLVLFLALGGACFSLINEAQGEEKASGLQVSPVRFDWDMNAGEERTGVINLKNYDNSPRSVTIEVEDFYVTDETTQAKFFVPDSDHPLIAYDVINWIDAPEIIELAPESSAS